jgi:glutaconyl-CoA/methylmalonyl-CoA decarboxylase subunit gamma
MKKLLITVNGNQYNVEVEVLEDDENTDNILTGIPPATMPDELASLRNQLVSSELNNHRIPHTKQIRQGDPHKLTSPLNGTILQILVEVGTHVKENDPVLTLEAMKMKTNIYSPFTAVVKSIDVKIGDTVEQGHVLLQFE